MLDEIDLNNLVRERIDLIGLADEVIDGVSTCRRSSGSRRRRCPRTSCPTSEVRVCAPTIWCPASSTGFSVANPNPHDGARRAPDLGHCQQRCRVRHRTGCRRVRHRAALPRSGAEPAHLQPDSVYAPGPKRIVLDDGRSGRVRALPRGRVGGIRMHGRSGGHETARRGRRSERVPLLVATTRAVACVLFPVGLLSVAAARCRARRT